MIEIAPLGISGSKVTLCQDDKRFFVQKTGTERLVAQALKQKTYPLNHNGIYVPEIYNYTTNSIDMEYIHGCSFFDIVETGSSQQLIKYFKTLLSLVDTEFQQSTWTEVDIKVFKDKLNSVAETLRLSKEDRWNIYTNKVLTKINTFLNLRGKTILVPLGPCHGDLTFSNTILSNDMETVVLVDFLDTYLETPFQDISKLMQELRLFWTATRNGGYSTKVYMAYERFRNTFLSYNPPFTPSETQYASYRLLSKLFYIMTLVRLLPYVPFMEYEIILTQIEETLCF